MQSELAVSHIRVCTLHLLFLRRSGHSYCLAGHGSSFRLRTYRKDSERHLGERLQLAPTYRQGAAGLRVANSRVD